MAHNHNLTTELALLRQSFAGTLLTSSDTGYEEARRVYNGLVDKRPALIARCRGVADVVEAIGLAARTGLEVAVRGGGHNVAGRATIDDGLVIDLSPMKGIHVNVEERSVRVQGGVNWGEFNRETQLHGLATTGGAVTSTGVAGLTLGGGVGWLMGRYGLAADNLLSVELVTAEGRVLDVNRDRHPDLFWALRGGGGNFGVATSFEFRLHEVGPQVTGGMVLHPFSAAGEMLKHYRDATASLPDELTVFAALLHAPDDPATKLAAMILCHCGDEKEAAAAVRPFQEFGSPVLDTIGPISYCTMNTLFDAGNPRGALNYWKSGFLEELGDEAIRGTLECFAGSNSGMDAILIEHFHGAVTRVPAADSAFPHRLPGYNLSLLAQWKDPALTTGCIDWARGSHAAMKPFMSSGRYVNYLDHDEGGDPVSAAYGANLPRLQEIKGLYDPGNFFRQNQNIAPRPPGTGATR